MIDNTTRFDVKKKSEIDKTLFNLQLDCFTLPMQIAAAIDGRYYKLTQFDTDSNRYLTVEFDSTLKLLNFIPTLYNNFTLTALSIFACAVSKLGVDYKEIDIFRKKNISFDKIFNAVKLIKDYDSVIKNYLSSKTVANKTLIFLSAFNNHELRFLSDYLSNEAQPSQQNLSIFIEQMTLHKSYIKDKNYTTDFAFPDMRSAVHLEVDDALLSLNRAISPAKIISNDSYETSKLNLTVTLDNEFTLNHFVKKLAASDEALQTFFDSLKKI